MRNGTMGRMAAAGQARTRAAMPEVMALNGPAGSSRPANFRGKPPAPGNVARYAKGGKVKHDDAAQDKSLINKMIADAMPPSKAARAKKPLKKAAGGPISARSVASGPPQVTPMKKGGKACAPKKMAAGGVAKLRHEQSNKDGSQKAKPRKGMGSVF